MNVYWKTIAGKIQLSQKRFQGLFRGAALIMMLFPWCQRGMLIRKYLHRASSMLHSSSTLHLLPFPSSYVLASDLHLISILEHSPFQSVLTRNAFSSFSSPCIVGGTRNICPINSRPVRLLMTTKVWIVLTHEANTFYLGIHSTQDMSPPQRLCRKA